MNLPQTSRLAATREIGVGGDDRRALAAQLERDGGEMLGGRTHHDLADPCSSGEQDVVEALLQERRRLVAGATSDGLATTAFPAAIDATIGAMSSWSG